MGGIYASPLLMVASAIVTTLCVQKLVKVALYYQTFSYSLVVEQTFGAKGRLALDIMIALTQFSFSIS